MVRYDRLSDYKVDGVVESSRQGTFIGTVDTMPDASTAKGVTVLYTGADSTYSTGTYYTSDGTSWSVATVSQSFQDLASDVETLTGRVDGITSFEVEVVSSLPSTGVAGTIYFTPSTNSQTENVYDEYVYVSSGWEQVGSTTFTLNIVQASTGITINDTALQSATASVTGLMTASQATELYDHEDRIQALESDITLLSSSEEVENLTGRVVDLETTTTPAYLTVTASRADGTVVTETLTVTATSTSGSVFTATVSNGTATLTLDADTYAVSVSTPSGCYATDSQTVTTSKGETTSVAFAFDAYPVLNVSVTPSDVSGTVTATSADGDVVTAPDSDGTATLTLDEGTWSVSCTVPGYGVPDSQTITVERNNEYTMDFTLVAEGWIYTLVLDSELMQTDPTGCFTYADDAEGFTPVYNESDGLAGCTQEGDWAFDRETGTDREGMFYATFQEGPTGQYLHELLDPYDLTSYIALWDDVAKDWDYSQTGSSSIATENTMLCIPTLYRKGSDAGLVHTNMPSRGTPYAHTIDGHVYEYLAVGVYLGYVDTDVLKSVSGVTASTSSSASEIPRADYRTYAHANEVRGGHAVMWNYHMWRLMAEESYMRAKSWNLQERTGWGGLGYTRSTTGTCDTLGPYAGDVVGTSSAQKLLVENFWGSIRQWVDDEYISSGKLMVGQNSSPSDDAENKDGVVNMAGGGFQLTAYTDDLSWGMGSASGGSMTTGLCDYQSMGGGSSTALFIGGRADGVDNGYAGPGFAAFYAPTNTSTFIGTRLAFVFDIDAGLESRVTTLESTVNSTTSGLATKASQTDLDALSSTVSTNTSNIATNTSNIATNTTDISSLKTRVSTAESDIDSLESSVSTLDGTVSTLSTTVAGKQDTVTGAATTIVSSNLTASRALASNSSGKVAVSSVTSTELGYLSGVTSNIQTQINTLTSGTFTVQVVDALPSTGGDTTIYFVPNGSSGDNTHDEYMYVDGTWELIGSTAFTLDIAQDASGITINGTTLQEASTTATGLMTAGLVNDIEQNATDIDALESSVTTLQGTVSGNTSDISTLQSSVETNTSNISTLQSSVATNTSNISTLQSTVDSLGTGVASVTGTSPITASTTSGAVTVAHSTSGVGTSYASSYLGSTTAVPRLYIDSYGHITGVTTATIYPPTTAGTAGQVWRSDGSGQGQWATLSVADASTASTSNAPLSISSSSTAITLTQGVMHSGSTSVSSSTRMPTISIDAYGRVTSLGYNTVYPPTSAGTSGQYWKSDGSGQGVWQTADTTPTSSSTNLVTSDGVYSAIETLDNDVTSLSSTVSSLSSTVSSLGTYSYTTSYGSCSSISSLYSVLSAHAKSGVVSLAFSFENSNGNDGTVFLTAPVYYSTSTTVRIGPGFYSIWTGSGDNTYSLYYMSVTSSGITVVYRGWSDSSTSSVTVSEINHCYYSYIY